MGNLKQTLTTKEIKLLTDIIEYYDEDELEGYLDQLSPSEKGVAGSLVKKGLIFDASDYECDGGSNWKPKLLGLEIFKTL